MDILQGYWGSVIVLYQSFWCGPDGEGKCIKYIKTIADATNHSQFTWDSNLDPYRAYLDATQYHWGSSQVRTGLGACLFDLIKNNINPDMASDYKKRAVNFCTITMVSTRST